MNISCWSFHWLNFTSNYKSNKLNEENTWKKKLFVGKTLLSKDKAQKNSNWLSWWKIRYHFEIDRTNFD